MTAYLSPLFGAGAQLADNNGALLSGGKIYTYQAGSAVLYDTWTSIGQTVLNSNPIILDASGRVPNEIWLASGIAYKFILQDSLSNVIGTWDNIQGINDANWSVYAGSASIPFSVAAPTTATQAVQLQQVSLLPTVTSATATDIFGAAGATISIYNSTPVTTTSFTDCTSEQVGSVKRVIPVQAWSVTASANLVVDGATSGTFVMPAGAKLEVLASTTTKFEITTISATGTWAPNGAGLTVVGAFSSVGTWSKIGNSVTIYGKVIGTTSVAVSTNGVISSNLPFTLNASYNNSNGLASNTANLTCVTYIAAGSNTISAFAALAAATYITFNSTYQV